MLRISRIVFFLFLLVLCAPFLVGEGRVECDVVNSRILNDTVHYCVLLPPGYDKSKIYPVLYFLHGLGDNEQALIHMAFVTNSSPQTKRDFLMVAPEGKRSFFINSTRNTVRYSDFFMQEFIPLIESKYHVRRDRGGRAISGISMGGYGALRFAFAYPAMFSAVSAMSPALITDSPVQINAALHSGLPTEKVISQVFGDPIDLAHWRQNSPFLLARTNEAALRRQAIYFNCGRDDNYGFQKGAEALHRQLLSQGIRHEYHLYPGDHSVNFFAAHLGEMLDFHSRAFAGTGTLTTAAGAGTRPAP